MDFQCLKVTNIDIGGGGGYGGGDRQQGGYGMFFSVFSFLEHG